MPDAMPTTGPEPQKQWRAVLLTSLLCGLPALSPVFDFLHFLIPLAPFYFSVTLGQKRGHHVCLFAFIIAGLFSVLAGDIGNAIFPLILFPVGFLLAWAREKRKSVAWAGVAATGAVLLGWLAAGLLFWQSTGLNPYSQGLAAMDQTMAAMAEMYTTSGDFSPEVVKEIEQGFDQARQKLPQIFPALLIISAIVVSWLNMVLGNRLLERFAPERTIWPPYRFWRLPDNLVWLVILAGVCTIVPVAAVKAVGLNGLLLMGNIYFFQGVAVLFAMMARWNAPKAIRIFLYIFIFIQTYSIVLLAVLGIVDVWKDLGNIYKEEETP
ncbi:MAG: YybS family protein [Deltaproteobacteria bacterium]|nr:YybS family protein [Deltaproteobacteria bacterium]